MAKMRYPSAKQMVHWQFFSSQPNPTHFNSIGEYQFPSFEFYHSPHDWFMENSLDLQKTIQWNIFLNGTLENFYHVLKSNPQHLFLQGFLNTTQFFFISENKEDIQKI